MTVDKFGRYKSRGGCDDDSALSERGKIGPKGIGFNLTPEGDYDIGGKLLRNVSSARSANDAITLNQLATKCLVFDDKRRRYDAGWRPIGGLSKPKDNDDAVTKEYLESLIPVKLNSAYDFKAYRLQNIGFPIDEGDGISLKYAKTYFIGRNKYHKFDAQRKVICNVQSPRDGDDAANKLYVDNNVIPLDSSNGGWNCGGRKLTNVKDATSNLDAINFHQFEEFKSLIIDRALLKDQTFDFFDASSNRICNVADAVSDRDAVTRAQLVQSIRITEADSQKFCKKIVDTLEDKLRKELIDFAHTIKKQYSKVDTPKEKYNHWRRLWNADTEQPET